MKTKLMAAFAVFILGISAYSEDIKTLDGQVYKNAKIADSNPTGIDILYNNPKGATVLKGLKFSNLPESIRKRYGYNPKALAQYEKQVSKYKNKKLDDVISNQKNQIMQLKKQLKGKQGDFNVNLKHPDNEELIFSRRSSVKLKVVETTSQGVLVQVEQTFSGQSPSGKIMVDGLQLAEGSEWTGFIYPLGMKARYGNTNNIPLYTSNLNEGLQLLNDHLNMYGDYSANAANKGNTDPDSNDGNKVSLINNYDNNDNNDNIDYNDYYGGEPSYYIDNPYPVYWYQNNYWHHHHWHVHHWPHHHPYHP